MRVWSLNIPVSPIPKPRPRALKNGHVYTPTKYLRAEAEIRHFIALSRPPLFIGPVGMQVIFFLLRPKCAPKKRVFPTVKPDIDNLMKSVIDAMNGVVFLDDKQVVSVEARKEYCDTKPMIFLKVWGIE